MMVSSVMMMMMSMPGILEGREGDYDCHQCDDDDDAYPWYTV